MKTIQETLEESRTPDGWQGHEFDPDVHSRIMDCTQSGASMIKLLEMANNDTSFEGSYNDWFRMHFRVEAPAVVTIPAYDDISGIGWDVPPELVAEVLSEIGGAVLEMSN